MDAFAEFHFDNFKRRILVRVFFGSLPLVSESFKCTRSDSCCRRVMIDIFDLESERRLKNLDTFNEHGDRRGSKKSPRVSSQVKHCVKNHIKCFAKHKSHFNLLNHPNKLYIDRLWVRSVTDMHDLFIKKFENTLVARFSTHTTLVLLVAKPTNVAFANSPVQTTAEKHAFSKSIYSSQKQHEQRCKKLSSNQKKRRFSVNEI